MDRYDMEIEYDREGMQSVEEEKHSEGDWVKYEDVKSLEEKVRKLVNGFHQVHGRVSCGAEKKTVLDHIEKILSELRATK